MKDLSEFFDPGLKLPIRGKVYKIPAPSAEQGLRLHMLMQNPTTTFTDQGELKEIMELFGAEWVPNMVTVDVHDPETGLPVVGEDGKIITQEVDYGTYRGGVYQEMSDDGVSWPEIMHAGRVAMFDAGQGRTIAELMWSVTGPNGVDEGNPLPPMPGDPNFETDKPAPATPKKAPAKRAAKKAAKKAPTKKAATGRSTAARKRTG